MKNHIVIFLFCIFFSFLSYSGNISSNNFKDNTTKMNKDFLESYPLYDNIDDFFVKVNNKFYIMQIPVTQILWYDVMKTNPSFFKSYQDCPAENVPIENTTLCPNHPVENISWYDALEFINKLKVITKNRKYRFCTDEEWITSAKSIFETKNFNIDQLSAIENFIWYNGNSYETKATHSVAQKLPNKWGLFDMIGNIGEWTYSSNSKARDIRSKSHRIIRGGYWGNSADYLLSLPKKSEPPFIFSNRVGLRLCKSK